MSTSGVRILLIEDSPADVLLAREALEGTGFAHDLHVVEDGVEAMNFLLRRGNFAGSSLPDFILLDWNLPRKSGREVLAEMEAHTELRTIPVVVLTTSQSEEDVRRAYGLGANAFVTKPVDFAGFERVIRGIADFWFKTATLPQG